PVLEKQKGSDALRMHGGILNDIGTIYFEWGQAVNARRYFHRARQVLQDGGQHDLLPDIWSNLSSVELRLGHLTEAKAWSERALVLERKQGFPEGSPPTRINQALVRLAEGRTGEAEKELSQLLKLPSALLPEGTRALTLFNLGCAYLLQNRFDAARQYLTEGRKLMETTGNRLAYAKADCALGILYYNMKQDQVALEALKKAMQHLESAGAEVADPGQYGAFQDQFLNPYEAAGAILHRQGNAKEALETVEQGRAVGLARQASQTRAGYGLLSPPDLNALRQGRDDLFKAGWSLRKSQRLNNGVPAARKQYEDAEARLNVLRTSLRQRYPEYARLGAGASTSGRLAELARQHPDTLYLEWAVIDDKTTLLFALSHPSGVRSFLLPIGAKALEERVARWRVALTAPAGLNDAQQPQMDAQQLQEKAIQEPREALGLYRLLLEPLEEKGILSRGSDQKFKRVVTVGDGPLLELPWAALLDSKGRRLFERYAVSSSFSLQALTWPDQRKPATDSFFYVADPRGPKEQQLRADLGGPVTEKDKPLTEMPSLPEAREGSVEAARLFPRSKGLKGSEASESAVKARISECTVLHFATHGLLLKPGLESWLLLAPDTKEDGYLFAGEVAEMQLAARLAVLSACESGRGEIRGGEGLLGLAWGFRASGCPSVVASLWKVKALTTSKLINAFYAGLRKGLPKDLALQHAMRVVKKGAGTSEPYFWAGFQVLGDPSP
ncbi:MAG TPA: CHAT domain-containing protein, partial [Armatimonadota bacterium]|nr:CHAT domain-containing protein [Armatimonadota bacterium]